MPEWSPLRPGRGDACRYTRARVECFRAHYPEYADRRGIVRTINAHGVVMVRWDDSPSELSEDHVTGLVRADHDGPDPPHELCRHVTEARILSWEELVS